jgi:threonine/homoserine/homoserine lactone efflux protein
LYLAYKLWTAPAQALPEIAEEPVAQRLHSLFLGSLTLTMSNCGSGTLMAAAAVAVATR